MGVAIENNGGAIRLRFQTKGERYSFCPFRGARYANREDMRKAQAVAKRIEADILLDSFDISLERYKQGIVIGQRDNYCGEYDLQALWEKYRNFKIEQGLAPSTIAIDYDRRIGKLIPKFPSLDLNRAVEIRDWLSTNKSPKEAARIMTQINACLNWSIDSALIESNPFEKIKNSLKTRKNSKTRNDIDPFTPEERDEILNAFKQSTHFNYYYPLVLFLFYSGARPNEAIALRHADLDLKKHKLTFRYTYTERSLRKGLKSEEERTIILSPTAERAILIEIERGRVNKHGLVFPSKSGGYINWLNFNTRAWKTILGGLPHISYKKPYQIRHTFVTLMLKVGQTPQDIAKYCGNTPAVIFSNYAGLTRDFVPPEIIPEHQTNPSLLPVH